MHLDLGARRVDGRAADEHAVHHRRQRLGEDKLGGGVARAAAAGVAREHHLTQLAAHQASVGDGPGREADLHGGCFEHALGGAAHLCRFVAAVRLAAQVAKARAHARAPGLGHLDGVAHGPGAAAVVVKTVDRAAGLVGVVDGGDERRPADGPAAVAEERAPGGWGGQVEGIAPAGRRGVGQQALARVDELAQSGGDGAAHRFRRLRGEVGGEGGAHLRQQRDAPAQQAGDRLGQRALGAALRSHEAQQAVVVGVGAHRRRDREVPLELVEQRFEKRARLGGVLDEGVAPGQRGVGRRGQPVECQAVERQDQVAGLGLGVGQRHRAVGQVAAIDEAVAQGRRGGSGHLDLAPAGVGLAQHAQGLVDLPAREQLAVERRLGAHVEAAGRDVGRARGRRVIGRPGGVNRQAARQPRRQRGDQGGGQDSAEHGQTSAARV